MTPMKYLYSMTCYRGVKDKESQVKTEEFIVAESMQEAIEYWKLDLQCLNTEVQEIKQHVPVIAILPNDTR